MATPTRATVHTQPSLASIPAPASVSSVDGCTVAAVAHTAPPLLTRRRRTQSDTAGRRGSGITASVNSRVESPPSLTAVLTARGLGTTCTMVLASSRPQGLQKETCTVQSTWRDVTERGTAAAACQPRYLGHHLEPHDMALRQTHATRDGDATVEDKQTAREREPTK